VVCEERYRKGSVGEDFGTPTRRKVFILALNNRNDSPGAKARQIMGDRESGHHARGALQTINMCYPASLMYMISTHFG
jgi:hypothetical protein